LVSAKVLSPSFDQKLGVRCANRQGLRIGPCGQVTSLPRCRSEDRIDNWSLLLWSYGDGLVHGCVLRRFEYEDLVQPESQYVPDGRLDARSAKASDPKIEQA
jgi:hypothetical protein